MPNVKMPDGAVVFIPDNADPKLLAELELLMSPSAQQAPDMSVASQVGRGVARGLGLTARALGTGVTGTVGMVGDALNAASNRFLGTQLAPVSDTIQRGMTAAGIPEPETPGEKIGTGLATLMAGGMDPAMVGISRALNPAALYDAPTQQAVRAGTIDRARDLGYAIPPSDAGAGKTGRLAEAIGGRETINSIARQKAVGVTDAVLRREAGLPKDAPLTDETLNRLIDATQDAGYRPIAKLGHIPAQPEFHRALDGILAKFQGMSRSFPDAARDDVANLVNSYRVNGFQADDAISATRQLREQASKAFKNDDPTLGNAARSVAKALEDNIENFLTRRDADLLKQGIIEGDPAAFQRGVLRQGESGGNLLANFRKARTDMARQFAVRDAIIPGAGSGDAMKIAQALNRGEPLQGDLRALGEFANVAPQLVQFPKNPAPLFTSMEGYSLAAGSGAGLFGAAPPAAIAIGLPLARMGIRHGLLSPVGQRTLAAPHVPSGVNPLLLNAMPTALGLGSGLFGQELP